MIYLVVLLSSILLTLEYFRYKRNTNNAFFQESTFFAQWLLIYCMLNSSIGNSLFLKVILILVLFVMLLNNMNSTYKALTINPKYHVIKLILLTFLQLYTVGAIFKILKG